MTREFRKEDTLEAFNIDLATWADNSLEENESGFRELLRDNEWDTEPYSVEEIIEYMNEKAAEYKANQS